jgi:hypothetical protein
VGAGFTAEVLFWLVVLFPLPIFLLSRLRPPARLVLGAAGLVEAALGATGPEDPRGLAAVLGFILAVDAMVAELVYRLQRRLRARWGARQD